MQMAFRSRKADQLSISKNQEYDKCFLIKMNIFNSDDNTNKPCAASIISLWCKIKYFFHIDLLFSRLI